jgi:hypothetical protein
MLHPALGGVLGEGWASLVGGLCCIKTLLSKKFKVSLLLMVIFVSCETIFTAGSSKLTILAS